MGLTKKQLTWTIGIVVLIIAVAITYNAQKRRPVQDDRVYEPPTEEEIGSIQEEGVIQVSIESERGTIDLDLRADLMPLTVANFVKLAEAGFYDGLTFHRVEDWVIQGGDPEGTGVGGPGYTIELETSPELKNVRGAIAMARKTDPDSAGSQFYILREDADWLDGDYAVFGNVTSGMEAVDEMQVGDTITKISVDR